MEKLTKLLPSDRFGIRNSMFPGISVKDLELLEQKGHYPYSYESDRRKFLDTFLHIYHPSKIGIALSKVALFQLMKQNRDMQKNFGTFCTVLHFRTITVEI